MPVEDDQLVAKYGVLDHQVRLAAGQVEGGVEDRRIVSRLCPAAQKVFDGLEEAPNALLDDGDEWVFHSLPFASDDGGYDSITDRCDRPQFSGG